MQQEKYSIRNSACQLFYRNFLRFYRLSFYHVSVRIFFSFPKLFSGKIKSHGCPQLFIYPAQPYLCSACFILFLILNREISLFMILIFCLSKNILRLHLLYIKYSFYAGYKKAPSCTIHKKASLPVTPTVPARLLSRILIHDVLLQYRIFQQYMEKDYSDYRDRYKFSQSDIGHNSGQGISRANL